jgi:hypothetical protein
MGAYTRGGMVLAIEFSEEDLALTQLYFLPTPIEGDDEWCTCRHLANQRCGQRWLR